MKSNREFLDGIYEKAEKIKSDSTFDNNLISYEHAIKQNLKKHASFKYVKYAGMAAGLLLLISSALSVNKYFDKNKQNANQPLPRNLDMLSYTDQLINQATDIVEVKAYQDNNKITFRIIKSYKSSGNELNNYLNNDVIDISVDKSAIVFINTDSKNAPLLDVFVWEPDINSFVNPNGDLITDEILNNLN